VVVVDAAVAVVVADELPGETFNLIYFFIVMKICSKSCFRNSLKLALALLLGTRIVSGAADIGKTFATPEEAVSALLTAASAHDTNAFQVIFGPAVADIENPDRVQADDDIDTFNDAAKEHQQISRQSETKYVLEVGTNNWPFPIPIVKRDSSWFFDTEAGKEELLNRRIGKNELSTLEAMRAYVEAQREYASADRDSDEVLEYAQKINSTAGTKDGLYWPPDLDGEISPLGPLAAQAQNQSYAARKKEDGSAAEPFHGYFFKILTSQGSSVPGGKYNYIINGNMIAGFALVAWPADYGDTGIMTFMVNQQGRVYQKDLGADTAKVAADMKDYNPDKTWSISPD
jgi:hypothetical protein